MDKSNHETGGKIPKTVHLSVQPKKTLASSILTRVSILGYFSGIPFLNCFKIGTLAG
jgi:hypothetical protein